MLSSPKKVLGARGIPGELLISSPPWKNEEAVLAMSLVEYSGGGRCSNKTMHSLARVEVGR